jgi:hypothetical protein
VSPLFLTHDSPPSSFTLPPPPPFSYTPPTLLGLDRLPLRCVLLLWQHPPRQADRQARIRRTFSHQSLASLESPSCHCVSVSHIHTGSDIISYLANVHPFFPPPSTVFHPP